jgi:hypothetical protein
MRDRFYKILFLLCIWRVFAYAQTNFQASYCTDNFVISSGLSCQQISNGGYVFGGGVLDTISNVYYIHILKTNPSGVITDEQAIKIDAGNFSNHFMQQTSDEGFIISNFENVVKLDSSLNIQWSKKYTGSSLGEYGNTILQTSDGGYLIASDFNDNVNSSFDYFLTKIDGNGITQWSKNFYNPNYRASELGTKQTIDGGFISVGAYESSGGQGQKEILIIKTDALGTLLWSETIGGTGDDAGYSIIQLASGEYVISGTTTSSGAGMKDIFLLKINAFGNMIWSKTFGGIADDYANTIEATSDGGYIIGGSTESFGNGSDILLIKTDATGNILWSKTYGGTGYEGGQGGIDVGLDLAKTTDGGFLIASFTTSSPYCAYSAYLIKTDYLGNSGCNNYEGSPTLNTQNCSFQTNTLNPLTIAGLSLISSTVADTLLVSNTANCFVATNIKEDNKKDDIIIFPNPILNEANLQSDIQLNNATLTIENCIGQIVKQQINLSGKSIVISRDNLQSGLYILRLKYDDNSTLTRKIFIAD